MYTDVFSYDTWIKSIIDPSITEKPDTIVTEKPESTTEFVEITLPEVETTEELDPIVTEKPDPILTEEPDLIVTEKPVNQTISTEMPPNGSESSIQFGSGRNIIIAFVFVITVYLKF